MIEYDYNGRIYEIIPLIEMEMGAVYNGKCRNAVFACWNGEKFIHWRNKFGHKFIEEIHHPENDYHFDVFLPFWKIDDLLGDNRDDMRKLINAVNEIPLCGNVKDNTPRYHCEYNDEKICKYCKEEMPLCENNGNKWTRHYCKYYKTDTCIYCHWEIPF